MKHGTQWSAAEWLKVTAMAYGLIQQGQKHRDAVVAAQTAVLPKSRWREVAKLVHATAPSMLTWPKYLKQVEAMTPAEREAILLADAQPPVRGLDPDRVPAPAPAPAPEVQAKKPRKPQKPRTKSPETSDKRPAGGIHGVSIVKWTRNEWALIARSAKWLSERVPSMPLTRQVNEVQVWTLPADRLRPYSSIVQSYHQRKNGQRTLVLQLAEGLERGWTINTIPFTPPGSEPEKKAEAIEELAPPPVQVGQSPEADILTTAAPATGGALPSSSLTEAARVFGVTMTQALDTLLASHSQHLLGQVNQRVSTMAHDMGNQVAAMIEAAMRKTVHSMVEQELGPVSPPASPADEPAHIDAAPIPGDTPPRKRLKIDVVGSINPPVRTLVRNQYSGTDIDLRFFEGGHHERYTPDPARHCIFVSKRASHGLFDKLKKYRIQPIYVEPSASYITHAIDELQRSAMQ